MHTASVPDDRGFPPRSQQGLLTVDIGLSQRGAVQTPTLQLGSSVSSSSSANYFSSLLLDFQGSILLIPELIGRNPVVMMADHGEPCGESEAFYCLNGGTCFRIPSMSTLTCVCPDYSKGSRCQELQLFRSSRNGEQTGLIAAVVIITLLILAVLAVVIYYSCRIWRAKSPQERDQY
ncbi:hypothetical protein AAFF_G00285570 [Aldrovandia affinis]|uniref:EGF-like domain-containing protein n=1 Tax=Aldrovandia affinis TaxID=143900 RepID=A0AAD7X1Y9_9TELE|nr:hypothetical protein AAFF_G00285570 [Aldrovandia affinis]